MAAKSLTDKIKDTLVMMVVRSVGNDVLKSDAAKAAKAKIRELLGKPNNKAGRRGKKDEEDV